jgi:MFS family permease
VSAGCYGGAIAVFGLADALPLALAALALAGAADMSSVIFRATLWNQTIPDHMRGRLAGIEQLSYSIGPTLGTARSGAVASVTSVPFSIVAGGAVCVAGTRALSALLPRFWHYDARDPVSA